jgi:hypothetical protein
MVRHKNGVEAEALQHDLLEAFSWYWTLQAVKQDLFVFELIFHFSSGLEHYLFSLFKLK